MLFLKRCNSALRTSVLPFHSPGSTPRRYLPNSGKTAVAFVDWNTVEVRNRGKLRRSRSAALSKRAVADEAWDKMTGTGVEPSPAVIVAEDEVLICLYLQEILVSAGLSATSVTSGSAALSLLRTASIPWSGLVTDVRLEGDIDGWTLARQARELFPGICVVYVTGDSAADWSANGVPGSMVLQKPVIDTQLLDAVWALLSARARLPRG